MPKSIIAVNGLWVGNCGTYGIYYSATGGNYWSKYSTWEPPFIGRGLAALNGVVYAGSYYDGVWKRSGSLSNITGVVYRDLNNNGIRETGEPPLQHQLVRTIPGNWMATTDTGGNYNLITDAIGDTLRAVLPSPFALDNSYDYFTNGNASNNNFGIYLPPNIADLSVDLTNANVFRPGFQTNILASVKNKGSLAQIAQVQLTLDSNLSFYQLYHHLLPSAGTYIIGSHLLEV